MAKKATQVSVMKKHSHQFLYAPQGTGKQPPIAPKGWTYLVTARDTQSGNDDINVAGRNIQKLIKWIDNDLSENLLVDTEGNVEEAQAYLDEHFQIFCEMIYCVD